MRRLTSLKTKNSRIVPVFFACDDAYVKYMMVTMASLIAHASPRKKYRLYVLHTNISSGNRRKVKSLEQKNVQIDFYNVSEDLARIEKKLAVRDYYSCTTYYRVFIADKFPQYDKVVYIDSDTILLDDIGEFYNYQLGENYIGAIQDYLVVHQEVFSEYVERVLGVSRAAYFNAGVVLINSDQFRKQKIQKKFVDLLGTYSFVVAQDQDYLNILCQNHVLWIDSKWNVQMSETQLRNTDKIGLVHYNLAEKPWHYKDGKYAEQFWEYAKQTPDYDLLQKELDNFSEEDMEVDQMSGENLLSLAVEEIHKEDNYLNRFAAYVPKPLARQEIVAKIEQYEREGRFDEDVEADPPGRELLPNEVDYLRRSANSRIRTRYAFSIARWFMDTMLHKKRLIVKEIKGIENFKKLSSGAVITCNHINAMDSFAMQILYEKAHKRKKLFRVISEANYTSFPGFFGFLMRNCNTLPLSSNRDTMKKFMKAVSTILKKGHYVLIYPEQSMWWNYRKPKPLKKGAFQFAVNNNVPVLPCFITMSDSNIPGEDGYPVQEYTMHVLPPIYPDKSLKKADRVIDMMDRNYQAWKKVYEDTYGIKLVYTCDQEQK